MKLAERQWHQQEQQHTIANFASFFSDYRPNESRMLA
jgi:hypothetical protein